MIQDDAGGDLAMDAKRYTARGGLVGVFCALGGSLLLLLLPVMTGMDRMDGGYALQLLGLLVFATAIVLLPHFRKRARIMAEIHRKENVLAWWHYDPVKWEKERQKEAASYVIMRFGGIALAVLMILIGAVIGLADRDAGPAFFLMMLSIGGGFILITQVISRLSAARILRVTDEAVIHRQGVYHRGTLVAWGRMNRLLEVGFDTGKANRLLFRYRMFRLPMPGPVLLKLRIPRDQEATAAEVVAWYGLPLRVHSNG